MEKGYDTELGNNHHLYSISVLVRFWKRVLSWGCSVILYALYQLFSSSTGSPT